MTTTSHWTGIFCAGGALLAAGLLVWQIRQRRSSLSPTNTVVVESPPHPNWNLGDQQPSPYKDAGYVTFDPADMSGAQCYPLVISGIVPRPVAFVSSLNTNGVGNLSPFSYFGAMAHDPPCVAVSICRSAERGGGPKDTAQNILDTKCHIFRPKKGCDLRCREQRICDQYHQRMVHRIRQLHMLSL